MSSDKDNPSRPDSFIDPHGTRRSRAGFTDPTDTGDEITLNSESFDLDDDDFNDSFGPPSQTKPKIGAKPPGNGKPRGSGAGRGNGRRKGSSEVGSGRGKRRAIESGLRIPKQAPLIDGDEDDDEDVEEVDEEDEEAINQKMEVVQRQASRVLPMCHKGEWPALDHVLKALEKEKEALPSGMQSSFTPLKGIADEVSLKIF